MNNDIPKTMKAITNCFQTGPTNEYKVYASKCAEIERELNIANERIWELKSEIRLQQATIEALKLENKGFRK